MIVLQVKQQLVRGNGEGRELQVHQRLLAGSTAGVIAQTTIYPMEVSPLFLATIHAVVLGNGT